MVTRQHNLSQKYIYTYIYQYATQSGDRVITQYCTIQQPPTGIDCKQKQYALLKLSTRDKQNGVVIVNPNNYRENMEIHILSKHRTRNSFINKSFLFNLQNKSFYDRFISLVRQRKLLQRTLSFYFLMTNSDTY